MKIIISILILVLLAGNALAYSERINSEEFGPVEIKINPPGDLFSVINNLFAIFITPTTPKVGENVRVDLGIDVPCEFNEAVGRSVVIITSPSGIVLNKDITNEVIQVCSTFAVRVNFRPAKPGEYKINYAVYNRRGTRVLTEESQRVVVQEEVTDCRGNFCDVWQLDYNKDSCNTQERRFCHEFGPLPRCVDQGKWEYRTRTTCQNPTNICGNGVCDELKDGSETKLSCVADCGSSPPPSSTCGNGVCKIPESAFNCPIDCKGQEVPTSLIPKGSACQLTETRIIFIPNDDSKVDSACATGWCYDGKTGINGAGFNTCEVPVCCFAAIGRPDGQFTFGIADFNIRANACLSGGKEVPLENCGFTPQELQTLASAPDGPSDKATGPSDIDPDSPLPGGIVPIDEGDNSKSGSTDETSGGNGGGGGGDGIPSGGDCNVPDGGVCDVINIPGTIEDDSGPNAQCESGWCVDKGVDIFPGRDTGVCGPAGTNEEGKKIPGEPHPTCVEKGTVSPGDFLTNELFKIGTFSVTGLVLLIGIGAIILIFAFAGSGKK